VGIDAFHAAEVTPEDLSELDGSLDDLGIAFADAQVDAFWNDLNQCMNVRAFFFEALAADGDFADATVDCLHDTMDDNQIKRFMAGAVTVPPGCLRGARPADGRPRRRVQRVRGGKAGELTRVTRRL
jgi:hypothetical protein